MFPCVRNCYYQNFIRYMIYGMFCIFSVNAALLNGAMIGKIEPPVDFLRSPGVALLLGGCRADDCGSKSDECRYMVFIPSLYVVFLT